MSLEASITRSWYKKWGWTWCLAPLLVITYPYVAHKRACYLAERQHSGYQSKLPVIVVGNITVGGTGKSPMVLALVSYIRELGLRPGVVTRGHKSQANAVTIVTSESTAKQVGDEPLMLYRRAHCPVAVAANRAEAVKCLESSGDIDIVISDDGLQHYRMDRDIELVMIDPLRGLGNKALLPVGPLREPCSRLDSVDYVFSIGKRFPLASNTPSFSGRLKLTELVHVYDREKRKPLTALAQEKWSVLAGIGNPQRFLLSLSECGMDTESAEHLFYPDHHDYTRLDMPDQSSIVMTEKDAVKVEIFANGSDDWWFVSAELELPSAFKVMFEDKLKNVLKEKNINHE